MRIHCFINLGSYELGSWMILQMETKPAIAKCVIHAC